MLAAAGGRELLRMFEASAQWLQANAQEVNSINVFPVPDGDTGTNMLLTIKASLSAAENVAELHAGRPPIQGDAAQRNAAMPSFSGKSSARGAAFLDASAVATAMARGALESARGNSGIILSQFFRGLECALEGRSACSGRELRAAFAHADAFARQGISDPTEGTILTVLADVSRALDGRVAAERDSLFDALDEAVRAAEKSVASTPSLLPVLRESGVVDAGARGFFLLLEGAYHSLFMDAGMPAPAPIPSVRRKPESLSAIAGAHGKSRGFCTELLVQGEELSLSWIRERLQNEGTSLIVVGDSATIRIHIHTQHPEAVIEYARTVGSVSGVDVQDLDSQTEQFARQAVEQQGSGVRTAVLAIASGEGIARVFRGLGAEVLVPSGTGRKPREDEIFSAMERMPSREILLLPNGREAQDAVEKAAALTAKTVTVIPALTVPQGVAALVACRFEEDPAANARIMNAAIESVRTLEIARAPEGAIPSAAGASGAIGKQQRATDGRVVGYFDGSAATTADEPARVMERLLSRLNLGEVEVITLYYGEGEAALMEKTREVFRRMLPHASVETVDGGQGEPPLIISVE